MDLKKTGALQILHGVVSGKMLNTKQIVKKGFLILILCLLLVLAISPLKFPKNKSGANDFIDSHVKILSNNFFTPVLAEPTTNLHQVKQYVPMTDIYNLIKTRRSELSENATDQEKLLKDLEIVSDIDELLNIENPDTAGQQRKIVSISSALELYYFGNAQSINFENVGGTNTYIFENTISKILSLDYELLDDIDYSTLKAQKFVPIGTEILIQEGSIYKDIDFVFNGTFNGNGFEISNLVLAEYVYLRTTFEDSTGGTTASIIVSILKNYAMFARIGENGVVKNFILRNPSFVMNAPDDTFDVFKFSYLVGENKGLIYNVGVIDQRVNTQNQDTSGMIFTLETPTTKMATAGGFVHTNIGTIKNCYFVSRNIIVPSSMYRFSNVMPFVYANRVVEQEMINGEVQEVVFKGTIEGCAFESGTNYPAVKLPDGYVEMVTSYTKTQLESGKLSESSIEEDILINDGEINDTLKWNFYKDDGYPLLIGLTYDSSENAYLIESDLEFIFFSKLINLETEKYGKRLYNHTYILNKNINMVNFPNFKIPRKEFNGVLKGGKSDLTPDSSTNNNRYLYNLKIKTPFIAGNKYYLGLFSTLTGTVQNINFYNNIIEVTNSSEHYGKTFYVGGIAAELRGGIIKNIVSNSTVLLGNDTIGLTYAGGIVGIASGKLSYVHSIGTINGGLHDFNYKAVNAQFYVGGLVGTNQGSLTIEFSQNRGYVTGVGSVNNNYLSPDTVKTYTGGIIGEINNINPSTAPIANTNKLIYLNNKGMVDANRFEGVPDTETTDEILVHQFVGGIFGSVKGYGFKLNNGTEVHNGNFVNEGLIKGNLINGLTYIFAAGIGVANTTEELAKISYMSNQNGFDITGFNYQTHNNNIYYASTVVDNSTTGIELSRAYNTQSYVFDSDFFDSMQGFSNPDVITLAPFFTSVKDAPAKLLYVDNTGNLTVGTETSEITINAQLRISNITQATKVDYENVINSGDIKLSNFGSTGGDIFVAGITWILSYVNGPHTMTNVVNDGNIYTYNITSDTVISYVYGTSYSHEGYVGRYGQINNLFVSGLVNLNVGEIRNVFNYGNISSDLEETEALQESITGTANSYIGGITTINYNLIQDAANSGNLIYYNSNTTSRSNFAGTIKPSPNTESNLSIHGGIVINFEGGLVLGGISAALGNIDATILTGYKQGFTNGTAKITDTINSGNIFGRAKEYVRSGGVLGIALSAELAAGTFENLSDTNAIQNGPYCKGIVGASDPIGQSELYNGLNYGNVFAITQSIGQFRGDPGTGADARYANFDRPGTFASAGGVVGYGLTKMVRMINHGTIVSTDVAGGVIGATYIIGTPNGVTNFVITTVDINTAVHYGRVKAAKQANFGSIIYDENINFDEDENYYEDGDEEFLFPYVINGVEYDLAIYHNTKRGFGGFIGRLQRGRNGVMRSTTFNNVMNMDEMVDFIGRVDMNSISVSRSYYRLHPSGTTLPTYYTARRNDTTNYVVAGWYHQKQVIYRFTNANVTFYVRRTRPSSPYYVTGIEVAESSPNSVIEDQILSRSVIDISGKTAIKTVNRSIYVNGLILNITDTLNTSLTLSLFGLQTNEIISSGTNQGYIIKNNYTLTTTTRVTISNGSSTTPPTNNETYKYPIELIYDDENNIGGRYIFDPSFPLMASANTKFIYPVARDVLSDNLLKNIDEDAYGMYVLASSAGSLDGTALPSNIEINNLFKLDESEFRFIDFNNVGIDQKITEGDEYADKVNSAYLSMFQIRYNDKALILPLDDSTSVAQLTLYDPRASGRSPTLVGGSIDYTNKKITFNVSTSAFPSPLIDLYYEIKFNALSKNAIIAKDIDKEDDDGYKTLKTAYLNRSSDILDDEDLKFIYENTNPPSSDTITFNIKVYSELSIMDENIFSQGKYFEVFQVSINRSSTPISTSALITLNSTTTLPRVTSFGDNYSVSSSSSVFPSGSIQVLMRGSDTTIQGLLPLGHVPKIHDIQLMESSSSTVLATIDPKFYNVTLIPASGNEHDFGFLIEFSDLLIGGNYRIRYSYFDNSSIRSIRVDKSASNSFDIINVNHAHFSNDLEGLINSFERIDSSSFTTYTEFGYIMPGVTTTNQTLTLNPVYFDSEYTYVQGGQTYSYVDNKYYELLLNGEKIINEIRFAPFVTITNASVQYQYGGGKVQYVLTYDIRNETNDNRTVTHNILERNLEPMDVYLNDNYQATPSFAIEREAVLSQIAIDFKFYDNTLYQQVFFEVYIGQTANRFYFDETEIFEGEHIDRFLMYISGELEPGLKTYKFYLARTAEVSYPLGQIEVTKLAGSSAYLLDIKFTLTDQEIIYQYPIIRISDQYGNPSDAYDPRIYADGIDYADTISAGITSFRIDGKVSDIILENYSPRFFLPFGATIQRYDPKSGNFVDNLYDDFTGSEIDELKVVHYRVTSEDGQQTVDYFITVTDIKYNVTLRFEIYYEMPNGTIIDAKAATSPIRNNVLLISMKNYNLSGFATTGPTVYDFPEGINESHFTEIDIQASLYFFITDDENLIYRFGRSSSGAYNFNLFTPRYVGPQTETQTPGERYHYEMYIMPAGVTDWKIDAYKLPDMDTVAEGFSGLYYFVYNPTADPITRTLAIVIKPTTQDKKWGLYDEYASWDD